MFSHFINNSVWCDIVLCDTTCVVLFLFCPFNYRHISVKLVCTCALLTLPVMRECSTARLGGVRCRSGMFCLFYDIKNIQHILYVVHCLICVLLLLHRFVTLCGKELTSLRLANCTFIDCDVVKVISHNCRNLEGKQPSSQ